MSGENSNTASEQQRGRLRPSCMKTVSDGNSTGGGEAGSGATEKAVPAASELVEQVYLAISTNDRQMLGRCVGQAGRLEGGVSSGPTPAQAAHLKKDLDATFGGLKAARRARDLKQLKQAVKDVKKSGFAPFGKVALANAEKLVATLGRKQAQDEEGVAETGWWAVDRCGGRRSKAGECGQCAECIERELLVDFEEHAAAQAEWGGARRRGRR